MAVCACLNAADAHYWFAAGFGDIVKFGQARFSPFYTPFMGSIITLAVQLFFCYRISVFRSSAMWWSFLIAAVRARDPYIPSGIFIHLLSFVRSPSFKQRVEWVEE